MPFIDSSDPGRGWVLVGPDDGATRIWMVRGPFAADERVALHTHAGEEVFRVLTGRVRFTVGDERRECGRGTIVVIPPQTEHGFVALTEAELEAWGSWRWVSG
jgi:quercetin dioxygenase-like cupin family protein